MFSQNHPQNPERGASWGLVMVQNSPISANPWPHDSDDLGATVTAVGRGDTMS